MLSVGFEPAIPTVKRLQTSALERTVTGNGHLGTYLGVFPTKRGNVLRFLCFLIPIRPLKPSSSCCSSIFTTRFKMKKLLTHKVFTRTYLSQNRKQFFLKHRYILAFLTDTNCVLSEIKIEFLYIIQISINSYKF